MSNVFEERIKGKDEEIVWYTEQSGDGDRVKIREHLVSYVPVKADATFCVDENKPVESKTASKIKIISTPKVKKEEPVTTAFTVTQSELQQDTQIKTSTMKQEPLPVESVVHGKEVTSTEERQIQKERTGDTEITRKVKDVKTLEQEHKSATTERKVFGVAPPQQIAPRFTRKIQPCRAYERKEARFECEFVAKPEPKITWYRENFEIKSSDDIKVCFYSYPRLKSNLMLYDLDNNN